MSWKRICGADEVPRDSVKKFSTSGISLVVVNYGGAFRTMPSICPHMEEPLEESGIVADCVLTCTKHLWSWKLDTLEKQGEAEKDLKCYDTKEEDGAIFALIDKEIVYEFEDEGEMSDDDFFA